MKKLVVFVLSVISFVSTFVVFQQNNSVYAAYDAKKVIEATNYGPFNQTVDAENKIKELFGASLSIITLLIVGILIYAGVMFATAAGDDGKIEKAQKTATYAIIGLIVAFIAGLLVRFVLNNVLNVAASDSVWAVRVYEQI